MTLQQSIKMIATTGECRAKFAHDGKTLHRLKDNQRQTLHRLKDNQRQTLHRLKDNQRQTLHRLKDNQPTKSNKQTTKMVQGAGRLINSEMALHRFLNN